jgi:hypothetical protein
MATTSVDVVDPRSIGIMSPAGLTQAASSVDFAPCLYMASCAATGSRRRHGIGHRYQLVANWRDIACEFRVSLGSSRTTRYRRAVSTLLNVGSDL